MSKKAFGPVVAVALLIVVSVVAVLGFQTWYQTYSSQIFSQSETNSNSGGMNTGIANVINSELYFNNGLNDDITIENIKVNNEECYIYDGNYSPGISKFNLYNCLKYINTSTAEIVVVTNQGLYSKEIYLDSKTVSLTPVKSEPVYTSTFISVWNTSENGISNDNQIKLPLQSDGTYDFTIDWGDGTIENITSYSDDAHTYANPGIYTIKITGTIEGWGFNKESVNSNGDSDIDDGDKILEIKAWGPLKISDGGKQFLHCHNLDISAKDTLNLSGITDLGYMFKCNYNLVGSDSFNTWNTSLITNLINTFAGDEKFNADISSWNISSVTNMGGLFFENKKFSQDLSNWDVSSVTNMNYLFTYAESFNANISSWNVSSVNSMQFMFRNALIFNQQLNSWNTSSVTTMRNMFYLAVNFNGNISNWDVSSVTDMSYLFLNAEKFNQDLSGWDVSSVINYTSFDNGADAWNETFKPNFED